MNSGPVICFNLVSAIYSTTGAFSQHCWGWIETFIWGNLYVALTIFTHSFDVKLVR